MAVSEYGALCVLRDVHAGGILGRFQPGLLQKGDGLRVREDRFFQQLALQHLLIHLKIRPLLPPLSESCGILALYKPM